jgi:nucleotide-binding universal stress UspA family protein
MKVVIGAVDDDSGSDALALGAVIERSAPDTELMLVHVHTTEYGYISRAHVDFEWETYLADEAKKIVSRAKEEIEGRYGARGVDTAIHGHRASGHGLAEFAHDRDCNAIVIGSAPGGSPGRFQIGSTSNQLLHGSGVPIVLAPVGYRRRGVDRFGRVIVAFADGREGRVSLRQGATLARTMQVPLVVLTLLLHHRMYGSQLGADAEAQVLEGALQDLRAAQEEALAKIDTVGLQLEKHVTVGDTVFEAMNRMEWNSDDLLVVPSSRTILRRVFLGDINYKIVRATPVATMVLPRHTD